MKKISCLLLAAGSSSRMQGTNKLLISIEGQSLVRRTGWEIFKIPFQEVIAVTGHDSEKIAAELRDLPFQIVYNPNHRSGMHSSIRAGLNNLLFPYDGFFVCLSDQPGFDYEVLESLILAFEKTEGEKIVYPSFDGERGQPVLIPKIFVPEILQHADGDHGCQYLLKKYPRQVLEVRMDQQDPLRDVDTLEDLNSWMGTHHV